jgi:uncharacterized protein YdaU (DUF1376 family)
MNSLPWYSWYPGDFLNATRGWSILEKGGYREALDCQWAIGGLPADLEEFRRAIGANAREWRLIWSKIEPKFPVDEDGLRRNPRLSREQARGDQLSAKRAELGRLGAAKRWQPDGNSHGNSHETPDGKSHDFANGKTMPSTSTTTTTARILERTAAVERARSASPAGSRARLIRGQRESAEVRQRREEAAKIAARIAREKAMPK